MNNKSTPFPNNPSELIFCYLSCPKQQNSILGAVMLTNLKVRPLHFSCVSPVRPTKLQRILYGSTLEGHILVDVIAKKLLSDVPHVPHLIFVDTKELLQVSNITNIPTVYLKGRKGQGEPNNKIEYETDFDENFKTSLDRLFNQHLTSIDVLEPFKRLAEALDEIQKEAK